MVIQCPKCTKQYNVDGSKVTEQGVKITCPSCKHQFIVRKKQEDKEAEKQKADKKAEKKESKKPKTPPCAVCGEPSTHVFAGPPPRPLCEHHYQIEQEKGSRFFETDPGAAGADAGQTRVVGQEPADESSAEQVFESFDEDMSLFESDETPPPSPAGVSSPDRTQPPPPRPGGEEKKEKEEEEEDSDLLASPHEFLEDASTASDDGYDLEEEEEEDEEEEDTFTEEASAEPSPTGPEPSKPDAGEVSSEIEEDPFQPDTGGPPGGADAGGVDEFKSTNLDGSVAERQEASGEHDEGLFWESFRDTEGPETETSLDREMKGDAAPAPQKTAPKAPAPAKAPAPPAVPQRPTRPRSLISAIITLVVLAIAAAGAAYIAFSDFGGEDAQPPDTSAIEKPEWEDNYSSDSAQGGDVRVERMLPELPDDTPAGVEEKTSQAYDLAQSALNRMLVDTRAGYREALELIDEALQIEPASPMFHGLKTHILTFNESLADSGEVVRKAGAGRAYLDGIEGKITDSPDVLQAKAHVYINEDKTAAARVYLERYLEKHPGDGITEYLLGLTYRYQTEPDMDTALDYMNSAIRHEPSMVRALWSKALVLRDMADYDEALEVYEEILVRSPDRPGTAEAMEATAKEKSGAVKRSSGESGEASDIVIAVGEKEEAPQGLEATGTMMSDNIVEVINVVYPEIKKLDLTPEERPTQYVPNRYPRPPEEAPQ